MPKKDESILKEIKILMARQSKLQQNLQKELDNIKIKATRTFFSKKK